MYFQRSYGKAKFLCQLELVYEDDSREYVVTDESWKRAKSPIKFCCIYGGEDFDGRRWTKEYLNSDTSEIGKLPCVGTTFRGTEAGTNGTIKDKKKSINLLV